MTAPDAPSLYELRYERDDDGVPFAIEQVRAARWDPAFATPPDAATADVRVVQLVRGPLPAAPPPWLSVTLSLAPRSGVAEGDTGYVVGGEPAASNIEGGAPRRLWPWSPHLRHPGASLDEFLRAGATALRHHEPPPVEAERQAEALSAFARRHPSEVPEALAPLAVLGATALERWLHVMFGEPERFAEAILLARVEVIAPADAALLRFLREAHVPRHRPEVTDLAIDRAVLLEQASPWRYVEGGPMAAALAAVRSWQRRYARTYAAHYREAITERDRLLRDAAALAARIETLERLNTIASLGAPEGIAAIAAARASLGALAAMPGDPKADAAVTAGVRLGEPNPRAREFHEATTSVARALEGRLRRLSAALAARALAQHEDGLQAVLDAIALSEVDHLDRVLDERLTARIDALLRATTAAPLAVVAQQFPEVTLANLEAVVEEFRRAARQAIDASPGGRATLGGVTATPAG